jgi:hypothetical protein
VSDLDNDGFFSSSKQPVNATPMIRREIQWLVDEAADPTNFKPVLNPWTWGFEHKRTGLIMWRDGDLWKRRGRWPWMFSVRIALSQEESTLVYNAAGALLSNHLERSRQNKAVKSSPVLTQAFAQSDADKKLIESKVKEA